MTILGGGCLLGYVGSFEAYPGGTIAELGGVGGMVDFVEIELALGGSGVDGLLLCRGSTGNGSSIKC